MSVNDYDRILSNTTSSAPAVGTTAIPELVVTHDSTKQDTPEPVNESPRPLKPSLAISDKDDDSTTEVNDDDDLIERRDQRKDDVEPEEEARPANIRKIVPLIEVDTEYGSQVYRDRRRMLRSKKGKNSEYTAVVRRKINQAGTTISVTLEIISPFLKKVMRDVLKDFPTLNLDADTISLEKMYRPLFLRREALTELRDKESDTAMRHELDLIVDFAQTNLADTLQTYQQHVKNKRVIARIVWTLFSPGELIFKPAMGQEPARCFILKSCDHKVKGPGIWETLLAVSTWEWSGSRFKIANELHRMFTFDDQGAMNITDLMYYPLKFHSSEVKMRSELIERGKKYHAYVRSAHMNYSGPAWSKDPVDHKQITTYINSRVMVDYATFARENPSWEKISEVLPDELCSCGSPTCQVDQGKKQDKHSEAAHASNAEEHKQVKDADALLAPATVHGFALQEKVWVQLRVDFLRTIEWNREAYERLEIEEASKKVIQALVNTHRQHSDDHNADFDDVIAGKGLGLVFLLQGAPGLGKTMTAETIAELTRKPLYSVTSGELGTTADEMEQALRNAFRVARDWNAILLLDEADVFLARRSSDNLERNAVVSIFLRMMEYYQGILFLTTNRARDFDQAFMSRIHLTVDYPELSVERRERIWRSLSKQLNVDPELERTGFSQLAKDFKFNGREIKNSLRVGWSYAKNEDGSDKPVLTTEHLLTVARYASKIAASFEGGAPQDLQTKSQ